MPKQLLVRVQYPQPKSGKVIDTGVLDNVLIDIRKSQFTIGYDCCLGARLATDSQSASKSKALDFKSSSSSSGHPSAESLDVRLLADNQYYCKTAHDGTEAKKVPELAAPTILVEVYFNHVDSAETKKEILKVVYNSVHDNLAPLLYNPTSGKITICIMNFFLGDDDQSKLGKAGHNGHPLYMSFECKDCSS